MAKKKILEEKIKAHNENRRALRREKYWANKKTVSSNNQTNKDEKEK